MGDFLFTDVDVRPKLDHPDSCIRLACAVHRFRVPKIVDDPSGGAPPVWFRKSFATVGRVDKTRVFMINADDARVALREGLGLPKCSAERVLADAKRYQPFIHSILLSCQVQPEEARLDERLLFTWQSGVEHHMPSSSSSSSKKKASSPSSSVQAYQSEALMYDFVMTVVCQGLGKAMAATEASVTGDFVTASRSYADAAGIFDYLSKELLPQWISKGKDVNTNDLPSECSTEFCQCMKQLFMANGQQMAVATLLIKTGQPNYSLLGKLTLGVASQLETDFMSSLRRHSYEQMSRLDPDFLTLVAFQIAMQKGLSLYFQARDHWNQTNYGIAIALMSEATVAIQTRVDETSRGVPDISSPGSSLHVLKSDLDDLRVHMSACLRSWEKDNNSVFYCNVPQHVPAERKLQEGYCMRKTNPFELEPSEPVLLKLPDNSDKDAKRATTSSTPTSTRPQSATTSSSSYTSRPPPPSYESIASGNAELLPPPMMPPPPPPKYERSDSDLARELQQRFNQGLDG